jgi:hypothetical protein
MAEKWLKATKWSRFQWQDAHIKFQRYHLYGYKIIELLDIQARSQAFLAQKTINGMYWCSMQEFYNEFR